MEMNKIRAAGTEATEQKERAAEEEGSTKTGSKISVGNNASRRSDGIISYLEKDVVNEVYEEIECHGMGKPELRKETGKRDLGKRELLTMERSQLRRAKSRDKLLRSTSNLVPEMRRKASKRDLLFCSDQTDSIDDDVPSLSTIVSTQEQPSLSPPRRRPVTLVRRPSVYTTIQAPLSLDERQLAKKEEEKQKMVVQRKKLEEAKVFFEEGYRLCWEFQDSHSVSTVLYSNPSRRS